MKLFVRIFMKKFVLLCATLTFLCGLFSCKNSAKVELTGISVLGQYQTVSGSTCHIKLKGIDNIKASDVKVVFSDGSTYDVKMSPSVVLLKKDVETSFDVMNIEGREPKFNITVFAKLVDDESVHHSGDLRIWVPISSRDKNEAKEAIPDNVNMNDYTFEVPYNFEECDLPQVWVLYNKEPNAKVKSDDLRFNSKADGKEPLLLFLSFPNQGKTLDIPLYIDSSEGPKVYNLHVKTSVAPENQNANIKSIKFNGVDGIIEGKNITCPSSFPVDSTVNVVPTLENSLASCSINGGESVVIKEEGATFTIVVTPEKADGIRKTYSVFLEAPPNDEIKRVKALNHSRDVTPNISDLLDAGEIKKDGDEKYVTIPLYTASQDVALHFETTLEIANVFYMTKNRWMRLDSYSSSKKILTLREGVLKLPPSLSSSIKLKVLFKNKAYDTITIKFKKPDVLEPVTLMGLYINDEEIEASNVYLYFDGTTFPLYTAKGPKIYVDIVSKEALHATIEGKTYKSVYSGFLSYGLSIPLNMPEVENEKNINVELECDYATSVHLQFRLKRIAGAVDLVLYPSINGQIMGGDVLEKITKGENPTISILGDAMLFSVDTKDDCIKTMKVNEEVATKKTLIDSQTNEEFYRFEFLIKPLTVGEVKNVKVQIEPNNEAEYNTLEWRFKVKREE